MQLVEGTYATKAAREKDLKRLGLRNVRVCRHSHLPVRHVALRLHQNAFWEINHCDIHRAVSFDRLHAYSIGLFSKHLFALWKLVIDELDRSAAVAVDAQYGKFLRVIACLLCHSHRVDGMPRWPDLYHFTTITEMAFNDGSKFEDISKVSSRRRFMSSVPSSHTALRS